MFNLMNHGLSDSQIGRMAKCAPTRVWQVTGTGLPRRGQLG